MRKVSFKDRISAAHLFTVFLHGKLNNTHWATFERLRSSEDMTVQIAEEILQSHYEEFFDDMGLLEKHEWDYLERVRLVLLSDTHLERRRVRWLGRMQLLFLLLAISYLALAYLVGISSYLLFSIALSPLLYLAIRQSSDEKPTRILYKGIVEPFQSVAHLETAYRNSIGFRKHRYAKTPRRNSFRWRWITRINDTFWLLVTGAFLILFAPILLVSLAVSKPRVEYSVAVPERTE